MRLAPKLILITSAAFSLLLAAAWGRSLFRFDSISWPGADRLERNASIAEGKMGAWTYHVMTSAVFSSRGAFAFTNSEYPSMAGTREDLIAQWSKPDRTLKWYSDNKTKVVDRELPRFYRGIGEWRLGRFGIYTTGRQGETIRVLECPYWFLVLLAAAPGLVLAVPAYIRRRRVAQARCSACGYPVGVSPKCTECGADLPGPSVSR